MKPWYGLNDREQLTDAQIGMPEGTQARLAKINSEEWEARATAKRHWKDAECEDVQSIRRMNQPRLGPVTHIIEIGRCSFPYRSAEEAARWKIRFEAQGHVVNIRKIVP